MLVRDVPVISAVAVLLLQTTLSLPVPLLLLLFCYVPGISAVAVVPNVANTLPVACAPTAVAYP